MREIRQSGSEGGEEFKPLFLPLSFTPQGTGRTTFSSQYENSWTV